MITPAPSMSRLVAISAIIVLTSLSITETAQAQLFGARTLGQPLTRRPSVSQGAPPAMESAGSVEGSERFLRGNRSRDEFVGPSRGTQQGFIGSDQAIGVGRVRTSVESLREPPDRSAQINQPVPPLAAGAMYYPQLSISVSEMADEAYVSAVILKRDEKLAARLSHVAGSAIQISYQGNRAILSGIVESEAVAEKLRVLASFEPHIDEIECQFWTRQALIRH
ncbi:hypothetical protein RISK_002377 [Rhodopirellula islandica]|uniref:BON domain-containing protein n=1 Tax=Rhodopirellula islandica TaxID=595434 RepID=A0A0J1BGT0_RHOIS|nr:hypothetical protein [Rhodopirellula islandica]KLU05745.1 hypothetical protein RISK_002377 [Rhodopirellula islandica]